MAEKNALSEFLMDSQKLGNTIFERDPIFEENMKKISFTPQIYSPYYKLLDQEKVTEIKQSGMKVIPWTVNEQADIDRVKTMKVDGIITDYPERAIE